MRFGKICGTVVLLMAIFASLIYTQVGHAQDTVVRVDFTYSGPESGTTEEPYNSLSEGVAATPHGGNIEFLAGQSDEIGILDQPLSLYATNLQIGVGGGGNVSIGGADVHGNTIGNATNLQIGDGLIESHINTPGDVDWFSIALTAGNLFGIQVAQYLDEFTPLPVGSSIRYQLFDGSGSLIPWTGSYSWPTGVISSLDDLAYVWSTPVSGRYFLRVSSDTSSGIGSYGFRIASSRLGIASPTNNVTTNLRSYFKATDGQGMTRFEGPTPADRLDGEALSYVSGSIAVLSLDADPDGIGGVTLNLSLAASVSSVTFLDASGSPESEPETPVMHIHWGVPSADMGDGSDDIVWNYSSPSQRLVDGPNFVAESDINHTQGENQHNYVMAISLDDANSVSIPSDIARLMLNQDWYIDLHLTDRLDLYDVPIASSFPHGGLHLFDSEFLLNGFDTVPATGSTRELTVLYNDEFQAFYIPYDVYSELAGESIHIHSGTPGETGPVLIDLGTIPEGMARPTHEKRQISGTIPGLENILRILTNNEAQTLSNATYSTGWYLDIHTSPFFETLPELRADAVVGVNLEVCAEILTIP